MANEVVPFGKYKGQPVEVLLADESYREWLMAQEWFRARYTTIYQTVINYGGEPQETPEHNEMQASFLDDERCFRLAKIMYSLNEVFRHSWSAVRGDEETRALIKSQYEAPEVERRWFESGGWDVVYRLNWLPWGEDIRVELKPELGDDFPAVLRQVKNHRHNKDYRGRECVVIRRASFEKVTWEQVAAMFAASGITLLREAQISIEEIPSPDRSKEG